MLRAGTIVHFSAGYQTGAQRAYALSPISRSGFRGVLWKLSCPPRRKSSLRVGCDEIEVLQLFVYSRSPPQMCDGGAGVRFGVAPRGGCDRALYRIATITRLPRGLLRVCGPALQAGGCAEIRVCIPKLNTEWG